MLCLCLLLCPPEKCGTLQVMVQYYCSTCHNPRSIQIENNFHRQEITKIDLLVLVSCNIVRTSVLGHLRQVLHALHEPFVWHLPHRVLLTVFYSLSQRRSKFGFCLHVHSRIARPSKAPTHPRHAYASSSHAATGCVWRRAFSDAVHPAAAAAAMHAVRSTAVLVCCSCSSAINSKGSNAAATAAQSAQAPGL